MYLAHIFLPDGLESIATKTRRKLPALPATHPDCFHKHGFRAILRQRCCTNARSCCEDEEPILIH